MQLLKNIESQAGVSFKQIPLPSPNDLRVANERNLINAIKNIDSGIANQYSEQAKVL